MPASLSACEHTRICGYSGDESATPTYPVVKMDEVTSLLLWVKLCTTAHKPGRGRRLAGVGQSAGGPHRRSF